MKTFDATRLISSFSEKSTNVMCWLVSACIVFAHLGKRWPTDCYPCYCFFPILFCVVIILIFIHASNRSHWPTMLWLQTVVNTECKTYHFDIDVIFLRCFFFSFYTSATLYFSWWLPPDFQPLTYNFDCNKLLYTFLASLSCLYDLYSDKTFNKYLKKKKIFGMN